ncbi:expressed unknown protein [Seminavis robusta]|uniref:Uncharacterized protein n=1 Tax=Seminavis robusta TaxID=568900 RepID=A0A9N8HDP0_9STRA|nr:expressed unknown protein [Seminavis robusta]|eukprot:Sro470_g149560.1 n/a (623) ;mRNA; f:39199-41255
MKVAFSPTVAVVLGLFDRTVALLQQDERHPLLRDHAFERQLALLDKDIRRALQQEVEDPTAEVGSDQCGGATSVSNWIAGELERKKCEELPLNPFAQPLCEQYENIADIADCQDVTTETVGISASGVPVGSTVEECQLFVSALSPNPYFRDVDSLNHFFATTFAFPMRYECTESEDEMCELQIVYNEAEPGTTIAPTPAPETVSVPCTRCDFFYDDDETCFTADCNLYQCADDGTNATAVEVEANKTHQTQAHAPYHTLSNNVNGSALACNNLQHGNVSCEACLNAGCGAVEGFCLDHCLFAGDDLCWADAIFPAANSTEVCHFKAELEADAWLCGRSNITDCGTCTSTIKSDGVSTCEWYYQPDGQSFCGRGGCNLAGNCGKKTCEVATEDTLYNGGLNPFCDDGECVGVCFKSFRSDIFSFQEHYVGDVYTGCFMQTEQKIWTTEFHVGSSSIRKLEFKIGEHQSKPEGQDEDLFDYCELKVDGVACQRCNFCGPMDAGELDIDCSNVVDDAAVKCESLQDLYYGIVHKLLILEEGATHSPTVAPTDAPTKSPTANPTTSAPVDEPVESGSASTVERAGEGSETNEIIGFSGTSAGTGKPGFAAPLALVMLAAWATRRML